MPKVGSNSSFERVWGILDDMFTGTEGTWFSRLAKGTNSDAAYAKMTAPHRTRDYANEFFFGEKGKITNAQKRLTDLKSGLDGLTGDVLTKRQKQIADTESQIAKLREDYDSALLGKYEGEGYAKQYKGQKGRMVDMYGPGSMSNFIDFMNAGEGSDRAIKYGMLGGAYFGAAGAIRGLSGGGVTYNASGERDIMGVPFF